MAADFALTTYLEHLYLTDEQADELIGLLHDKYNVSSTNIQPLLNRIEDNLLATAIQTKSIIDSQAESKDTLIQEHNKLVSSGNEINNIQNISKRSRGL